MKKLTAMLLSLMMCVSLLAIPAQAAFQPEPGDPGTIIGTGSPKDPEDPGDDNPENPGNPVMPLSMPGYSDDAPTD